MPPWILVILTTWLCGSTALLTARTMEAVVSSSPAPPSDLARWELGRNTTRLLDHLLQGYDRRLRPGFGGPPTLVDVNMNIRSMGPISEIDMAHQMDCYFRQSWVDRRLEFSGPSDKLVVAVNILDRLWMPDTHFFNGKKSYLHTVTTPNKLLRIHRDGRILYSMRLTIKASCPMHLENFPMDIQTCPLQLGSHGYGRTDVSYIWTDGAGKSISTAQDMRLSQFDLVGIPSGNYTMKTPGGETHTVLFANFVLRRNMGYFLINVYVPCSLLVVLSWVAFWINREATADRIALGVMTVLTMAFLGIDNRRDLPKVSYSTALDYYVGICFAFVLASILQFAGVHFFTKHGSGEWMPEVTADMPQGNEAEPEVLNVEKQDTDTLNMYENDRTSANAKARINGSSRMKGDQTRDQEGHHGSREMCCLKFWYCLRGSAAYRKLQMLSTPHGVNSVSQIDIASRVLFPLAFVLFHIVYWWYYVDSSFNSPLLNI